MTEIDFQKQVYERLAWEPGMVPFRFNCGKLANGYSQAVTWGSDKSSSGVADLGIQLPYGLFAWIELKQPGKSLRKDQSTFANEIHETCGLYFVAKSLDEIEAIIEKLQRIIEYMDKTIPFIDWSEMGE